MKKKQKSSPTTGQDALREGRRKFIGYGAMGLILTPLVLTGCGDNAGDNRTPPKGGGKKPPPRKPGGGGDGSGAVATRYKAVPAGELATRLAVSVDVAYKGKHVEWTDPSLKMTGLPPDDGSRAMGDMEPEKHYPTPNPLGTKYVVNERVLTVKDGDKVKLCNAVVVLRPVKVEKVAANTVKAPPMIDNKFFRFEPRVLAVAMGAQLKWHNGDLVKHEVKGSTLAPEDAPSPVINPDSMGPDQELKTNMPAPGWFGITCGLHSWELQRIMVSDHAYTAVTDGKNKGKVTINDVAEGDYELQIWHETQDKRPYFTKAITVTKDAVNFPIELEEII